jgi:uncharacterized membrane protein
MEPVAPGNDNPRWTDDRIDSIMGNLLRAGVFLSAAVVLLGGVMHLNAAAHSKVDDAVFHGEPAILRSIPDVIADAMAGKAAGVMQLGVLLLLATPIARVAFSVFAFAVQRDWKYVVVTLFVFSVLIYSVSIDQ